MATYIPIPITDYEVDDPWNASLAQRLRDNPIAAYQACYKWVRKSSNQSVTNQTTLVDDNHLIIDVTAEDTYHVFYALRVNTYDSADFKFKLVGPSGATGSLVYEAYTVGTSGVIENKGSIGSEISIGFTSTPTVRRFVIIDAYLQCGSTGGQFKLQWAQDTADTTSTEVTYFSYMTAMKLNSMED